MKDHILTGTPLQVSSTCCRPRSSIAPLTPYWASHRSSHSVVNNAWYSQTLGSACIGESFWLVYSFQSNSYSAYYRNRCYPRNANFFSSVWVYREKQKSPQNPLLPTEQKQFTVSELNWFDFWSCKDFQFADHGLPRLVTSKQLPL